MRVGFTGTQSSVTQMQWNSLYYILQRLQPTECHHGDCIGADKLFHQAAKILNCPLVVIHPPQDPSKRAFCQGALLRPEKPYLERNKDIVNETERLIGMPKLAEEEMRSGTWSTIRYARKLLRPIYLILPNGQVNIENLKTEGDDI